MKKLAVLISTVGTGSNLQAIIDAIEADKLNAEIAIAISDSKEAFGIKRAQKHSLKIAICPKKENLFVILEAIKPDYIVLAGWKQIVSDEVIAKFQNRILNLHPGLVPQTINGSVKNPDGTRALWNRGLLAEKAVQNFLGQNSTYAGSSIHFLSKEFDFGPVLKRGFVKVHKNDTVNSLYARLKKVENRIYVESLQKLC
ncbi:hypothetical protein A3D07_03980 [Candidatus Curtissbacteria bacterium RIFCSPHIGHO2_02_FULL_42_15]|uniref:phosphoribosylglycinamide formyltransferase 1 n=1 Tax=Candidatus Curtissbacteria bacterium RIFCSPHIGHO2_02_FULL_42_15 TaxID=1797716 RepID=A0A1F5GF28_9BACT|nr:MAG: hypothetical protein A3D07_03980 [Candidatus Curtissbacteria bacterium RIFCSPHIGHO2_02_FULL_42_15]